MTQNLIAVYQNGAFRPTGDAEITLPDGARVRLTVEPIGQNTKENVLDLAAKVYAGLSEKDVADVERIAMDRAYFFSE